MMRVRCLTVMAVAVFCVNAGAQTGKCLSRDVLRTAVPGFQSRGLSRIETLLKFGRQNRVCFGVEWVDSDSLTRIVTVSTPPTSIGDAVAQIMPASEGYTIAENRGVIQIRRAMEKGITTYLDVNLPSFQMRVGPVQEISNGLRMALASELDPTITGFAGNYRTGDAANVVGPFAEKNKDVREILDEIVMQSKHGASWLVNTRPPEIQKAKRWDLWTVIEYETPTSEVTQLLGSVAVRLNDLAGRKK
jgi:hypothetical protein